MTPEKGPSPKQKDVHVIFSRLAKSGIGVIRTESNLNDLFGDEREKLAIRIDHAKREGREYFFIPIVTEDGQPQRIRVDFSELPTSEQHRPSKGNPLGGILCAVGIIGGAGVLASSINAQTTQRKALEQSTLPTKVETTIKEMPSATARATLIPVSLTPTAEQDRVKYSWKIEGKVEKPKELGKYLFKKSNYKVNLPENAHIVVIRTGKDKNGVPIEWVAFNGVVQNPNDFPFVIQDGDKIEYREKRK